MGRRKLYSLTDAQADLVRIALITHENVILDELDHDYRRATRILALLRRARVSMTRPAAGDACAPAGAHPKV